MYQQLNLLTAAGGAPHITAGGELEERPLYTCKIWEVRWRKVPEPIQI